MNIRQMKTKNIALIIFALNSVYVVDAEEERDQMLKAFKKELSARGLSLKE